MRRPTKLLLALLLVACTPADPAPDPLAARIDSIALDMRDRGPLAGLSIAVARSGRIVHARGYGLASRETGQPATASTPYNIASVAKILAAATVASLVDDGLLALDDRIVDRLPVLARETALADVTLGDALSMTAGLPDYIDDDLERWTRTREPLGSAFVLDWLHRRPLLEPPRTQWIYSNTGFYLAGLIVERITGYPWAEMVDSAVAGPLGLDSIDLCDDVGPVRARGYELRDGAFVVSVQDLEEGIRGDAGLCASVEDLALLPSRLLRRGILSDTMLSRMLGRTVLDDGRAVDYGLGVARGELLGHTLWGHLGGAGSIIAVLAHYPADDVTIAVLTNTRRAAVDALVVEGEVARLVLGLESPELRDLPLGNDDPIYEGTYRGDRTGTVWSFVREGPHLVRITEDGTRLTLLRQDDHTFGRADWPMDRFVFHVRDGRATAVATFLNGFFDGDYRRYDP